MLSAGFRVPDIGRSCCGRGGVTRCGKQSGFACGARSPETGEIHPRSRGGPVSGRLSGPRRWVAAGMPFSPQPYRRALIPRAPASDDDARQRSNSVASRLCKRARRCSSVRPRLMMKEPDRQAASAPGRLSRRRLRNEILATSDRLHPPIAAYPQYLPTPHDLLPEKPHQPDRREQDVLRRHQPDPA